VLLGALIQAVSWSMREAVRWRMESIGCRKGMVRVLKPLPLVECWSFL
jgi:hypothetical protein